METFSNICFIFCTLPLVVLLNYLLKTKLKNFVVLFYGLLFLFWTCSVKVVFGLFCVSLITYILTCVVFKLCSKKIKLVFCSTAVVLNIFTALYMFYYMFRSNLYLGCFFDFERVVVSLTCMANISYAIDVFKKHVDEPGGLLVFLTYVFMFPKLFLGPVVVFYQFRKQLVKREVDLMSVVAGAEQFIVGFFKKVVFANEFLVMYKFVVNQSFVGLPLITAWFGAFSGFLSLVFNFSGYSDMAQGFGKMLGFNLPCNYSNKIFFNGVVDFLNKFNFMILKYFKFYVFPWWKLRFYGFKFLKHILIAFCYAIFFGANTVCFFAVLYFLVVVWGDKFLNKMLFFNFFEYVKKFLSLGLILVGTVLFDQKGLISNFDFLVCMFGKSGIFMDFSFIFLFMLFKFSILVLSLLIFNLFKFKFYDKIKQLKIYSYFRTFSLIFLFLVSVLISLNQV